MDNHRSRQRWLPPFLGLSLLLHFQALLVVLTVFAFNPDGCHDTADVPMPPIEVALVPTGPRPDLQKAAEIEKELQKEREEDRKVKGQVVDLPRPSEERQPEKSRLLSEYDSSVEREMRGPPRKVKAGRMAAKRPAPIPPHRRARQPAKAQPRRPLKLAMRTQVPPPSSRLSPDEIGTDPPSARKLSAQGKTADARQQLDGSPQPDQSARLDLWPTEVELSRALGTRANDALPNIEEGEHTLLNSKRWRYASFFNRVKRQVAQNWHPDRVYRRRDPSGNVYGFRDRLTILRVKLSPRGALRTVRVEKASGLGFLDSEAMNAFRLAEPFPNPPKGLVEEQSGLISFRFGFLFELSHRANLRIFRFNN